MKDGIKLGRWTLAAAVSASRASGADGAYACGWGWGWQVCTTSELSVYDVLRADKLVFDEASMAKINETFAA